MKPWKCKPKEGKLSLYEFYHCRRRWKNTEQNRWLYSQSCLNFSSVFPDCCMCSARLVTSGSLQPHGAHQAPPSVEFSRQENWSGLPFPAPADYYVTLSWWSLASISHGKRLQVVTISWMLSVLYRDNSTVCIDDTVMHKHWEQSLWFIIPTGTRTFPITDHETRNTSHSIFQGFYLATGRWCRLPTSAAGTLKGQVRQTCEQLIWGWTC